MGVEDTIAARIARGNVADAATIAIEVYGPSALRYLRSLLGDDDAEDAFSRFAENLWRGLPGFRGECSLRAWVFRVAWHAALRELRDPYRRRGERLPTSAASRLAASVARSSMVQGGGRLEQLRKLRSSLDPEEQTLLVLRVDRELEWNEVAAVLRKDGSPVTAAALRKRFERLKGRLAVLAREHGLLEAPRAPQGRSRATSCPSSSRASASTRSPRSAAPRSAMRRASTARAAPTRPRRA